MPSLHYSGAGFGSWESCQPIARPACYPQAKASPARPRARHSQTTGQTFANMFAAIRGGNSPKHSLCGGSGGLQAVFFGLQLKWFNPKKWLKCRTQGSKQPQPGEGRQALIHLSGFSQIYVCSSQSLTMPASPPRPSGWGVFMPSVENRPMRFSSEHRPHCMVVSLEKNNPE